MTNEREPVRTYSSIDYLDLQRRYYAARADVARLQGRTVPLTEWQQMEAERDKLRAEAARLKTERIELAAKAATRYNVNCACAHNDEGDNVTSPCLMHEEWAEKQVATLTSALEEANGEREKLTTWLRQTQRDAGDDVRRLIDEKMAAMAECEAMRANDARWRYSRICGWPNDSSISGDELDRMTDEEIAITQEKRGG